MIALAATSLGGCATAPLFTARDDVHRFFAAVRDNDQPAFDSLTHSIVLNRCDKTGVRSRPLQRCVEATANPPSVPVNAFRKIAAYGYGAGQRSSGPVGLPLRADGYSQVCVREKAFGDCLLCFGRAGEGRRLVGVANLARLEGL